jgi:hypothetical protein
MTKLGLLLLLLASPAIAAPIDDPTDPDDEPAPTTGELCATQISAKHSELSLRGINLGAAASTMKVHSGSWCSQAFQFGRIHSDQVSAAAIYGATLAKYTQLGLEVGFGRASRDPALNPQTGVTVQWFGYGHIVAHPTFGSRAIRNPLSALWSANGAHTRFGYPTTDQIANPFGLGAYSHLERGYLARTNEMGEWIDFTGAGEGRVSSSVQLFAEAGLWGTTLTRSLSSESPVALRPQFGTLDGHTSSLIASLPARTSLYLYDESPLEGRFVRITGADNATVRVSSIGTFMNDRPSSMMLVNHGTASAKKTLAGLRLQIQSALDALDTGPLLRNALAGHDASGTLTWNSDVTVTLIPGERLIQFSRRAYMNIDAGCVGIFNCNADGNVMFTVAVRPYVSLTHDPLNPSTTWNSVHTKFIEGSAVSIGCSGLACDDRNTALADLFEATSVRQLIQASFDASLDTSTRQLIPLRNLCTGIDVNRVNVLPDALEIVVADTPAVASCAMPFTLGNELDYARPTGRVTTSDGSAWNGAVTVVPNNVFYPPLVLK